MMIRGTSAPHSHLRAPDYDYKYPTSAAHDQQEQHAGGTGIPHGRDAGREWERSVLVAKAARMRVGYLSRLQRRSFEAIVSACVQGIDTAHRTWGPLALSWTRHCDAYMACVMHDDHEHFARLRVVAKSHNSRRLAKAAIASWSWQVTMLNRGLKMNAQSTRLRVKEALETWLRCVQVSDSLRSLGVLHPLSVNGWISRNPAKHRQALQILQQKVLSAVFEAWCAFLAEEEVICEYVQIRLSHKAMNALICWRRYHLACMEGTEMLYVAGFKV